MVENKAGEKGSRAGKKVRISADRHVVYHSNRYTGSFDLNYCTKSFQKIPFFEKKITIFYKSAIGGFRF